jgi:hypothetical protein
VQATNNSVVLLLFKVFINKLMRFLNEIACLYENSQTFSIHLPWLNSHQTIIKTLVAALPNLECGNFL